MKGIDKSNVFLICNLRSNGIFLGEGEDTNVLNENTSKDYYVECIPFFWLGKMKKK